MTRRDFFRRATVAAAALAVDPERPLWIPGAKTISIPAPFSPGTLRALENYLPSVEEMRAMANHIDWLMLRAYQQAFNKAISDQIELRARSPYWRGPGRFGASLSS